MDYNNPETWVNPELHNAPAFDVAGFQARINDICGLNQFGGPNVLLTWMPARENYSLYFCAWDSAGIGTETEPRAAYVYDTLSDGQGNELEIPPPRWALKQFVPPAMYLATDYRTRWKKATKNNGKQVFVQEIRPARPADGFYAPMIAIGKHNEWCCVTRKKQKEYCWGDYRTPDESHLLALRRAVAIRAEENTDRPEAGLTPKVLKAAMLDAARTIERQEKHADEQLGGLVSENLDSMLAYYTGDKSFLDRKKDFSFPAVKTDAGLIVPRI